MESMTKVLSYKEMKESGFDGNQSRYIFTLIKRFSPITDNELSRLTKMRHTSVVRSRNSLMKEGKIELVETVRDSETNKLNDLWECV